MSGKVYLALFVAVVAGALVLGNLTAQTASSGASTLAVCDIVQVFNNYQKAKDLTELLNRRRESTRAENEKKGKELDAARLELESLKEGSKEYEKRLGEVERLAVEHKAWLQLEDAAVLREHQRRTKEMYDEILRAIAKVARERGAQVVLYAERNNLQSVTDPGQMIQMIERRKVLYNDENLDLTAPVLASLNKAYQDAMKK